ncbi:MAG: elongation factor P [Candidatus Bipolaricaulota bacterium]
MLVAISIGEIARGMTLVYNGQLYEVVSFEHVKRARGSAFVRAKLRHLPSGRTIVETLRDSDHLEPAFMETRLMQYLYNDGSAYVFMDKSTFEEYRVPPDLLAEFKDFLLEGMDVQGLFYEGKMLQVHTPSFMTLEVVDAPPGVKGDTATGGEKHAKLETGAVVKVPLFVRVGDRIKVDTRTGAYVERVN